MNKHIEPAELHEIERPEVDTPEFALPEAFVPESVTDRLLQIATNDGAPAFWRALDDEATAELSAMSTRNPAEYQAFRAELKDACSKINVSTMDEHIAGGGGGGGGGRDSAASELVELIVERSQLWHDKNSDAFVTFAGSNEERQHWRIDSSGCRDWIANIAFTELGKAVGSEAVTSTVNTLSGHAKFAGEEHEPARRVAKTDEGYWLDIGNDAWEAICINANGWRVVSNPPVRFLRSRSTRPLPAPTPHGDIQPLWELLNLEPENRLLILAWIFESWRAGTPYAVLELTGEQGAAKSTTQTILRGFIDPSQVALRGKPKTFEDIYVAARNNHLLSFENLSGLSAEQSDALCSVATGAGHAARQLYTNGEESLMEAHAPTVLNGINPVISRPDLLDRALCITLQRIKVRRTETELNAAVEKATPVIFVGLLDLFVKVLAILPTIEGEDWKLPRMADFARLGEAVARVQGKQPGHFIELYATHRRGSIQRVIDASPVAGAIVKFINAGKTFSGTVGQLLELLNHDRPEHEANDYWPRSPRGLGDAIRRYSPALIQIGIVARVEDKPRRDGIHCELHPVKDTSVFQPPKESGNNIHNVNTFTKSPPITQNGEHVNVVNVKSNDFGQTKKRTVSAGDVHTDVEDF